MKFPRTMQEAFGPYTDHHVYETREEPAWHRVAYTLVLVASCVVIGLLLGGFYE